MPDEAPAIQDPEHKVLWEAIIEMRREIAQNGYAVILHDLARRIESRQRIWASLKQPRSLFTRGAWIIFGAIVWGMVNHIFKIAPTGP